MHPSLTPMQHFLWQGDVVMPLYINWKWGTGKKVGGLASILFYLELGFCALAEVEPLAKPARFSARASAIRSSLIF
uniref:Uncharacterized protein n=1 Tax=viral metagenome TaxID=1070528 RepID=A0A6C0ANS5_9ZZZZ